jgi:hypothetical protein
MAAFLSRTVDGALRRGSQATILDRIAAPQNASALGLTTVGSNPSLLRSDGADVWVANFGNNTVSRVRGSDGKLLETWTGAVGAFGVLTAMGKVFVTKSTGATGSLFLIDPSAPAGAVAAVASTLGPGSSGITFDGSRIWTANVTGSVSIVTPGASIPWTVTTVTTGFSGPEGAVYDGANVWVTDEIGTLLKLDAGGAVLQTVTVKNSPRHPAFDGTNIWVPNLNSSSVSVVRAASGAVLATLTGNGVGAPFSAAFDGQRVLIANTVNSVSLFKAADLTPLGFSPTGAATVPLGACSDGVSFWVTLTTPGLLARF